MSSDELPFFVYGTLRPNESNYYYTQGKTVSEQPAHVYGFAMYNLGTYPMIVPVNDSILLHGDLLTIASTHYQNVIRAIDRLEGYTPQKPDNNLYLRHAIDVTITESGNTQKAWIYVGSRHSIRASHPLIEDGDWVRYRKLNNVGEFKEL